MYKEDREASTGVRSLKVRGIMPAILPVARCPRPSLTAMLRIASCLGPVSRVESRLYLYTSSRPIPLLATLNGRPLSLCREDVRMSDDLQYEEGSRSRPDKIVKVHACKPDTSRDLLYRADLS